MASSAAFVNMGEECCQGFFHSPFNVRLLTLQITQLFICTQRFFFFFLFFCKHASLPINILLSNLPAAAAAAAAEPQSSLVVLPKGWSATFYRWSFRRFLDYCLASSSFPPRTSVSISAFSRAHVKWRAVFFVVAWRSSSHPPPAHTRKYLFPSEPLMRLKSPCSQASERRSKIKSTIASWKIQHFTAFIWLFGNPWNVTDARGIVSVMLLWKLPAKSGVCSTRAGLPRVMHRAFPYNVMQKCVSRRTFVCVTVSNPPCSLQSLNTVTQMNFHQSKLSLTGEQWTHRISESHTYMYTHIHTHKHVICRQDTIRTWIMLMKLSKNKAAMASNACKPAHADTYRLVFGLVPFQTVLL